MMSLSSVTDNPKGLIDTFPLKVLSIGTLPCVALREVRESLIIAPFCSTMDITGNTLQRRRNDDKKTGVARG
jgi:hypothetical protein